MESEAGEETGSIPRTSRIISVNEDAVCQYILEFITKPTKENGPSSVQQIRTPKGNPWAS